MKALEYWEIIFQQHKYPCFLADVEDYTVVYQNTEMEKLLGHDHSVTGRLVFDIFEYEKDEKNLFNPSLLDDNDIYTTIAYESSHQKSFDVSITKVYYQDECLLLCQFSPKGNFLASNYEFEMAMSQCINVLHTEDRMQAFVKILAEFHQAERTFLFIIDKVAQKIPAEYTWTIDSTIPVCKDITDFFPYQKVIDWFNTKDELGFIETDKNLKKYDNDSIEFTLIRNYSIYRMVQCVITDLNNEPIAVIAVANAKQHKGDFRLCKTIERFIQNEITKVEKEIDFDVIGKIDFLTGFYSRAKYSEYISNLKKEHPKQLGVVFANINGLRQINEEHDYTIGDSCIKNTAQIIKDHFKADFYRLSGDEFVGFFSDITKENLEKQARALRKEIKEKHNDLFAIGYAWGFKDYDPVELVKEADTVMYINKQEYYSSSSKRTYHDITDNTLNDLLSSLKDEEFLIYLQPQINLETNSLSGAEALIRKFDKKNKKMVFPDQFIPLYEKKSIIRHIDIFVVEQVCSLLKQWQDNGKALLPISVNLSRVTLLEFDIVDTIAQICDKYAIPREKLVIEVTERVGLVENDVASSLVTEFKDKGFKISLDDFGCAYSNIVTLAQIEVDEVKLDKSLVDFMTTNTKNQTLVRNVLRMCSELDNTSTLAEGIECQEQSDLLHKLGCHLGQGYLYSRPIPVQEFCEKYCS